jgi:hypothetical protein
MEQAEIKINMNADMELHTFEKRLIEMLRSMVTGEVSSIKIQDGLPVIFQITHTEKSFMEAK